MKVSTSTVVVLAGGVAAGLIALAVTLHAQDSRRSERDEQRGRRVEVITGRGSEIGVSVRDVDQADVTREKLKTPEGAVIDEVRSDSPAAKAGLKSGDVVVEFDAERVRSARQLTRLVQETPSGRTVKAAVIRGGERITVNITPDSGSGLSVLNSDRGPLARLRDFRFDIPPLDIPGFDLQLHMRPGRLGIGMMDLNDQLAGYFGVKDGVLVTSVSEGSAAARAGLKAGDVITAVNGRRTDRGSDLRYELSRIDGGEATFTVMRDRKEMSLKVSLDRGSDGMRPRVRRSA